MSLNEVLRPVDVQNFPSKNERSVKNGGLFGEIMRRKSPLSFLLLRQKTEAVFVCQLLESGKSKQTVNLHV